MYVFDRSFDAEDIKQQVTEFVTTGYESTVGHWLALVLTLMLEWGLVGAGAGAGVTWQAFGRRATCKG